MRYNTFENNESEEKKLRIFAIFKRKKVQEITPMGNTKEYRVVRCDVPAGKPVFSPVWKGCNFEQRTGAKEKGWEKLMRIVKIAEIRERGDKPFYTGSDREKMPAERSFCIKNEDRYLTGRIKESTDRYEKRKNIRIQVENYRIELRRLQSNIPFSLLIVLLMLVNLIINQLAPFFSGLALNAFNLTDINIFQKMYDCVVFSNFHQMVTGLIPLPGSAGISEIVFASLFGQSSGYYSDEFYLRGGLNIILLVWRFGTFYIPFIINGIFAATYKSRGLSVKERIIPVGNRKTMLTIQLETYAERKASSDTIYETKALERKQMLEKIIHHDKNKKTREISISQNENIKKIEYEDKIVIGDDDEE